MRSELSPLPSWDSWKFYVGLICLGEPLEPNRIIQAEERMTIHSLAK